MKSDSELMNELARRTEYLRVLTLDESRELKQVLLGIYKDFAALCDQYGLVYMLAGGSCLGAVRHRGFIPWDDDLDVMMPRSDYEKFIDVCKQGKLGEQYELDYPNRHNDAKVIFLKILKKGTVNEEIFDDNSPFSKGIYLDVFVLDGVPRGNINQKIKGFIANVLQFISILVFYAQYPSKNLKKFMSLDKDLNKRYKIKVFFGIILSIIPHRYWVYWFDCFVSSSNVSKLVGIPTGRKRYNGEIFPKEVYFPPQKAMFEGIEVFIPADYDTYLKNLYKNYMILPPVDKRERHFIVRFNSGK